MSSLRRQGPKYCRFCHAASKLGFLPGQERRAN